MAANNVVTGPWGKLPPSPDDGKVAQTVQSQFVDIMTALMLHMEENGVDTLDDLNYTYDLALLAESLRAYLYKVQGKYHPCQDIASNLFHWTHEGLQINNSIIVEFK